MLILMCSFSLKAILPSVFSVSPTQNIHPFLPFVKPPAKYYVLMILRHVIGSCFSIKFSKGSNKHKAHVPQFY